MNIRNVTIKNPWKPYHNCDGIDVHSCSNVRISDCYIDTGDDGICLKSIPDWFVSAGGSNTVDYSKPRIPCENVVIENCVVEHAHSGVGIWAEVIGGLRNVVLTLRNAFARAYGRAIEMADISAAWTELELGEEG